MQNKKYKFDKKSKPHFNIFIVGVTEGSEF